MAIKTKCPHCSKVLTLKSEAAVGKKVPCPQCKETFTVKRLRKKKPAEEPAEEPVEEYDDYDDQAYDDYGAADGDQYDDDEAAPRKSSSSKNSPDSRTYRHQTCNATTTVSGDDFLYVASIFNHPDRTFCQKCGDNFPMHEFCWQDTDESLVDYYSRYAGKFRGLERFFGSGSFGFVLMGIGLLMGLVIWFVLGQSFSFGFTIMIAIGTGIFGAFVGFVIGASVEQGVNTRVLGTIDYTKLK